MNKIIDRVLDRPSVLISKALFLSYLIRRVCCIYSVHEILVTTDNSGRNGVILVMFLGTIGNKYRIFGCNINMKKFTKKNVLKVCYVLNPARPVGCARNPDAPRGYPVQAPL